MEGTFFYEEYIIDHSSVGSLRPLPYILSLT